MPGLLRPAMTMSDIYAPGCFYFPRAIRGYNAWLPREPDVLDSLTGGQLVVAGDMPVICSEGFETEAGLELLACAGLGPGPNRVRFVAGEELKALSRAAASPSATAVIQHAMPEDLLGPAPSWIDLDLLQYLNNKANLPELVSAEHTPPRLVVDPKSYFSSENNELPVVLKVVTEQSNGGGCGIMICRTPADLNEAERLFEPCERIVVEQMLEISRNPCLNFAVLPDGEVRYLGFADQDIGPDGKYRGNWIDLDAPIPQAAVDLALEPIRRGAAMGYRGVAGVDLAFTPDGRILVLDMNFRVNGCTTMILLADAVAERSDARVMHFRKIGGGADALARTVMPYVASSRLIPLGLFDPAAAGHPRKAASVQAMIVGASREEVLAIEAEIARSIA
jgi:hypothetical protein